MNSKSERANESQANSTKSRGDTNSTNQANHASLGHMPFPSSSEGQFIERERERERESSNTEAVFWPVVTSHTWTLLFLPSLSQVRGGGKRE